MTASMVSALVLFRFVGTLCIAFPSYQDPETAEPPLPHPKGAATPCSVRPAVLEANLTGYGQVVRSWFEPPGDGSACVCTGSVSESCWSQVVLLLDGSVKGVQFDRFGAVWFRGVELLRTTTPEPSPAGIAWHVERDITDFQQLFHKAGEMVLMIPNIVDPTYTGALHINVSITFYQLTASPPPDAWNVLPLQDISNASDPLNALANQGALGQASMLRIDPGLPVSEIRLHVFASGHGCEEFWYTNVPGTDVPPGACGGGAYRELLVYVDGILAGAVLPFPVIYTGGINPLLWRPLTGILSFDIPPYEFDLTPFAGWLLDGKAHNVTVQVWGNNPEGTWFLDPVLLLRRAAHNQSIVGGRIRKLPDAAPNVSEHVHQESNTSSIQWMRGRHSYEVQSRLLLRSGQELDCQVSGELQAASTNTALSASTQITQGSFTSKSHQTCGSRSSMRLADYLLDVTDISFEDNETLFLNASINISRTLTARFQDDSGLLGTIGLNNSISSMAVYNRSRVNRSQVNLEMANSSETFLISTEHGSAARESRCYEKRLKAFGGNVTSASEHDSCQWPFGVYVCGSTLCGHVRTMGPELEAGSAMYSVQQRPAPPNASLALLDTLRRPGHWRGGFAGGLESTGWTQSWQPEVLYA